MSARVAYLTGRAWRRTPIAEGALPSLEAPDHALIVAAGRERGVDFAIRHWDEPSLPEQGFDAAIIRSCWDYTERREEFIARIAAHERAGLRVFNTPEAVAWNSRKTYLDQLGDLSIPTLWTEALDIGEVARAFDAFDSAELVVKPQIGAGASQTLRLKRNAWSEADLREGPQGPAMVQPYFKSIEDEGERSLFWFGGKGAHAIRKVPHAGRWLANQPGATEFFVEEAPKPARDVAEAALALAPQDLLYVRVDLVRDDAGAGLFEGWRVIEIEAIEPYLYLGLAPEAAGAFVDSLAVVLGA